MCVRSISVASLSLKGSVGNIRSLGPQGSQQSGGGAVCQGKSFTMTTPVRRCKSVNLPPLAPPVARVSSMGARRRSLECGGLHLRHAKIQTNQTQVTLAGMRPPLATSALRGTRPCNPGGGAGRARPPGLPVGQLPLSLNPGQPSDLFGSGGIGGGDGLGRDETPVVGLLGANICGLRTTVRSLEEVLVWERDMLMIKNTCTADVVLYQRAAMLWKLLSAH